MLPKFASSRVLPRLVRHFGGARRATCTRASAFRSSSFDKRRGAFAAQRKSFVARADVPPSQLPDATSPLPKARQNREFHLTRLADLADPVTSDCAALAESSPPCSETV